MEKKAKTSHREDGNTSRRLMCTGAKGLMMTMMMVMMNDDEETKLVNEYRNFAAEFTYVSHFSCNIVIFLAE